MAVGVLGIWLAGSNNKLGWGLGVFAQLLWIVYAMQTDQYGFIVSALVYGFVYARNFYRWKSEQKQKEETK
jgi:nicotinamide riboside transporter PnuC